MTGAHSRQDVIDAVAGLAPGSLVAGLRRERPEISRLSQKSHEAALTPREPGNIGNGERAALACRMARLLKDDRLAAHFEAMLEAADEPALAAIADPKSAAPSKPRLAAMVRHVDLVTQDPGSTMRTDIEALRAAGLTDRDIVTLSGLIAFVNYQARVAAGLRVLKGA